MAPILGVMVPVTRLASMLNDSGTASAHGSALPRRFGIRFFGNGIIPQRWTAVAGPRLAAWQVSPQLEPLLDVKSWLTVSIARALFEIPETLKAATAFEQAAQGTTAVALPER